MRTASLDLGDLHHADLFSVPLKVVTCDERFRRNSVRLKVTYCALLFRGRGDGIPSPPENLMFQSSSCTALLCRATMPVFALMLAVGTVSAQAQQIVTTTYPGISITTGNPTGTQLSAVAYPITVNTTGTLEVEFTTSAGHCSSMFVRFELDGNTATPVYTSPTVLAANQSTGFIPLGPVSPGTHTVSIRAEGTVNGCNAGTLVGWGGTARVRTSQAIAAESPNVVPTLDTRSIGLLGGLIGIAALIGLRRRWGA